jgi:hypothetical protein
MSPVQRKFSAETGAIRISAEKDFLHAGLLSVALLTVRQQLFAEDARNSAKTQKASRTLEQRRVSQARKKLRAMKSALAGRSANLRMKYGYHSLPNGT